LNENILIVDDDIRVRKTLSSILLEEGYSVDAVENGRQAIRASEKAHFDVALVDVELPDMKGTELLLGLKQRQPEMIKIIVTGFPSIENAMKAVNEGADGYILKPFDVPKLLEMIRKHLDEKAAEHLRIWMEKSEMEQRSAEFSEQFKRSKGSIFSH
jgi:DNA-binding NtrC family response regulator